MGASGDCAGFNPYFLAPITALHALVWDNGVATDLGNLGGSGRLGGNIAFGINSSGEVVGNSDLKGDTTTHGFVWTKQKGMIDIGTLPGDVVSAALAINDGGEVVGVSEDADYNSRAIHWQNGTMTDLNSMIPASSLFYLLFACSINSSGEVIGLAVNTKTGDLHGYMLTPKPEPFGIGNATIETREVPHPVLSENTRKLLKGTRIGRFAAGTNKLE